VADAAEFDLNALLACMKRELAFRQRCYPRWVQKGMISQKKAERELDLMRLAVDYFTDAVFRSVTRQPPPLARRPDASSNVSKAIG